MSTPNAPSIEEYPLALPNILQYFWSRPYDGGSPLSTYTLTLNPGSLVYTPSPNATNFTISGLTNGLTYNATLKAANSNGFSPEVSFSPSQPGNLPNPPASIAAYPAGTNAVLVTWTPPAVPPNATILWYVIETESSNPADPVLKFSANGLTQTSYLVPGLNSASSYYFKVYAVNNPGYSQPVYSNPVSFVQNAGNVQWATRQNGSATTNIGPGSGGCCVDKDGNVYISGLFNSTTLTLFNYSSAPSTAAGEMRVTLAATYTLGGFGQNNSYIAKYNASGILQWATVIQGTRNNGNTNSSVEVDSDNNIYVVGIIAVQDTYTFTNYAGIVGGVLQLTTYGTFRSSSANDMYLVKYNSSGQIQWFTTVSGPSTESINASAKCITIDTFGNVYINIISGTASIFSAGSVISGVITPILYGNINTVDTLIVKWNLDGRVQWVNKIVQNNNNSYYSISSDRNNNIYILGRTITNFSTIFFQQSGFSTNFISTSIVGVLPAINSLDGYIAKYDSNGNFKGVSRSLQSQITLTGLTINQFDEIYITGQAQANIINLHSFVSTLGTTKAVSTTQWAQYKRLSTFSESVVCKLNTDLQFQSISGISPIDTGANQSISVVNDSFGNIYHGCI
jgi:hypothetical protein